MSYSYKVVVTTATDEWTITNEDAPDYGLADPLTLTRSMPESDFWPVQPAPARARFRIVAETYGDVSNLNIGTPIQVRYYSPSTDTDPLDEFAGRISDLEISPHKFGVIADVTCVDYLADIAEHEIRQAPADGSVYPIFNPISDLIGQLWDRADMPGDPPELFVGFVGAGFTEDPLTVPPLNGGNLATVLEQYLAQWIVTETDFGLGVARYVIVPKNTGPDPDGYDLVPMWRAMPGPAWVDRAELDAAKVILGGTFTRRKGSESIDVVVVDYLPGDEMLRTFAYNFGDPGLPWASIPAALVTLTDAQKVADFYVPNGAAASWVADEFTWPLHQDAVGAYLPFGYYGGVRTGYPVTIDGIDDRWCPTGTTYSGMLAAYTLTVSAGKPVLTVTLRPSVYNEP